MLIDFFYTLRSARLPVSVKEYLVLVEALKEGVVGPVSDGAYSLDDFYYLSRTALVKDEKHYDKFDRAFAAYFKGVEMIADFTKDIPLEWLRKNMPGWDEQIRQRLFTDGAGPAAASSAPEVSGTGLGVGKRQAGA